MAELRLMAGAWGVQLGRSVPQTEGGNKAVCFESQPSSEGFRVMRDVQNAKAQAFKTGDRRFAYNLAVNLAQM